MNELFDKLIIRIIFAVFICLMLFVYKYVHSFLYPAAKLQLFKRFYPSQNPAYTLHFFSRLIGIGIIFSQFRFDLSEGIFMAASGFVFQSSMAYLFYLLSIYIVECMALYKFEYKDEILKKKNMAYALICLTHSLTLAFVVKTILEVSDNSLIMLFFLWTLVMVIIGFAIKSYRFISKFNFVGLLMQQNISVAFSYTGFFWGWIVIICSSVPQESIEIRWYVIQILLKIILALIIYPIFQKGLIWIFRIKEKENDLEVCTGYGIYEGSLFFTSCYLTSIIIGNIQFGSFYYPVS